jgi:hypothetical protein
MAKVRKMATKMGTSIKGRGDCKETAEKGSGH